MRTTPLRCFIRLTSARCAHLGIRPKEAPPALPETKSILFHFNGRTPFYEVESIESGWALLQSRPKGKVSQRHSLTHSPQQGPGIRGSKQSAGGGHEGKAGKLDNKSCQFSSFFPSMQTLSNRSFSPPLSPLLYVLSNNV
jgi:hypothetical protein